MICKSPEHPSHRCIKIRQLRDKKQPIPPNFCETHCGRVTAMCKNKACAIIKLKSGRVLNLTCQKPNHGNKHFLLCDIETCRKNSEKYWKKLQERNEVVHFTPAEDLEGYVIKIRSHTVCQPADLSCHLSIFLHLNS